MSTSSAQPASPPAASPTAPPAPPFVPQSLLLTVLSFPILSSSEPTPSTSLHSTLSSALSRERALTSWLLKKKSEYTLSLSESASLASFRSSRAHKRRRNDNKSSRSPGSSSPAERSRALQALRGRVAALRARMRSLTLTSVEALHIAESLSTRPAASDFGRVAALQSLESQVVKAREGWRRRWGERRESVKIYEGAKKGGCDEPGSWGGGGDEEGVDVLRGVLLEAVLGVDRWWDDEGYTSIVLKVENGMPLP